MLATATAIGIKPSANCSHRQLRQMAGKWYMHDVRLKGIQIIADDGATFQIVWIVLNACRKIVLNAKDRWSSEGRGEEKRWTAELKSRQRCPQTGAKTKHPHTHKCFKAHNANFRQVTLCAKQATLTRPLHMVTMAITEQRAARKLQLESWPKKNWAKKVERSKKKMKYNFNGTKHKSWKCLWCWCCCCCCCGNSNCCYCCCCFFLLLLLPQMWFLLCRRGIATFFRAYFRAKLFYCPPRKSLATLF